MVNKQKANLVAGFGISLLLLIAASVMSYISISRLIANDRQVMHTNLVVLKLESILSVLKDAETGQRGYLLTGEKSFLEPYLTARQQTLSTLDSLAQLTVDNAAQQAEIPALKKQITVKYNYLQETVDLRNSGIVITPQIMLIGKSYMDAIKATVRRMQNREKQLLTIQTRTLDRSVWATCIFLIAATILSVIITTFYYFRIRKDYRENMRLEAELKRKDDALKRKIAAIDRLAGRISKGDYHVRINMDDLR